MFSPRVLLACVAQVLAAPLLVAAAAKPPRPWPPDAFRPLTADRVAALPSAEQAAWRAYLEKSQALAALQPVPGEAEAPPPTPGNEIPAGGIYSRGLDPGAPREVLASAEAQQMADHIVACQTPAGAWTKGNDYTRPPAAAVQPSDNWSGGTFDNNATTTELRLLAEIARFAPEGSRRESWRDAFRRGLDYCLSAQYPNGGIPQIYPLVGGYHDAVTYNDNAMVHVLELFRDVAAVRPEFAFISPEQREACAEALARGVRCILTTQIRAPGGRRTGWCQQYDALTLQPCAARNFEPIAASASESAGIVQFLMRLPETTPELREAVRGTVAWFQRTALPAMAWDRSDTSPRVVTRPGAPPMWARFYEIGTDEPIFGDRDRTIHYVVDEISLERRRGYAWYGDWPAGVLQAYASWPGRAD